MKKYQRVTPIGIWTGKVMIGGHYQPPVKQMTENECFVQRLLRGRGLPVERRVVDLLLKFKSMFRRIER